MRQVPAFDAAPIGIVGTSGSPAISFTTSGFSASPSAHGRGVCPAAAQSKHSGPAVPPSFSYAIGRSFYRSMHVPPCRNSGAVCTDNLHFLARVVGTKTDIPIVLELR
jgi:hypothetical protein